MSSNSFIGL